MRGKSGSRLSAAAYATAGQLAYEPVRSRSALDPVAVALDDAASSRREGSRLARCRSLSSARAGSAAAGSIGPVEQARRGCRRSAAARARAARGAPARRRRRARARRARSRRRRGAGCARARPRRRPRHAPPVRRRRAASASRPSTTPMSGSRSWNDALKSSSRQPRAASRADARELVARCGDRAVGRERARFRRR